MVFQQTLEQAQAPNQVGLSRQCDAIDFCSGRTTFDVIIRPLTLANKSKPTLMRYNTHDIAL